MTVSFSESHEIINFLEKAGFIIERREDQEGKHYMIIGTYIKKPIGCTSANGRLDVLMEEPDAEFQEVKIEKCPVCNNNE